MADVRESFPSLEGASGEGLALRSVQQGEAVAGKNGALGFAFKDGSGNAIAAPVKQSGDAPGDAVPTLAAKDNAGNLVEIPVKQEGQAPGDAVPVLGFKDSSGDLVAPQLNAAGAVPVTFDAGTEVYARGTAAGNASLTDVAVLTLTASTMYKGIEALVSCFRDAIFQVVQVDDATTTVLAEFLCGPGQFTNFAKLENMIITAGASGTQQLKIRAQNLNALSDFRATIASIELP
jgi:hypothetical protein